MIGGRRAAGTEPLASPPVASQMPALRVVAVAPPGARRAHGRLLSALEDVFPLRFCDLAARCSDIDGELVLGDAGRGPTVRNSSSEQHDGRPRPRLTIEAPARARGAGRVRYAASPLVQRPLWNVSLPEDLLLTGASPVGPASRFVLAGTAEVPLWWVEEGSALRQVSAVALPELAPGEVLRDALRVGRSAAMIPLVHFLRAVCEPTAPRQDPLRACFVIDDPNMLWPSYGYLRYRELSAHAIRHGYHVSLAMVPLDAWRADGRAVRVVRESPDSLSLVMHGNDHRARELGRLGDERTAERTLVQALRRIQSFERRAGVEVERVMVPPHEACSPVALKAMARLGYDAACIGRARPWDAQAFEATPASAGRLPRWHPTDMVDGTLPVLPRYLIGGPWEELVLRAVLGQPLIVFAHHWDFAEGLDRLAHLAGRINGLGETSWESPARIARSCVHTTRVGDTLIARVHARAIAMDVPESIRSLDVLVPWGVGEPPAAVGDDLGRVEPVRHAGRWSHACFSPVPGRRVLTVLPARTTDPAGVNGMRWALWPASRRVLVQARERTLPIRRGMTGASRARV